MKDTSSSYYLCKHKWCSIHLPIYYMIIHLSLQTYITCAYIIVNALFFCINYYDVVCNATTLLHVKSLRNTFFVWRLYQSPASRIFKKDSLTRLSWCTYMFDSFIINTITLNSYSSIDWVEKLDSRFYRTGLQSIKSTCVCLSAFCKQLNTT